MQLRFRIRPGISRNFNRISDPVTRLRRIDRHARAFTNHGQLINRVRALQVCRHQERRVTSGLQVGREFAGECRLTRTLQAGQHDEGRAGLGHLQSAGFTTEDVDEFVMHDLDDLLRRIQRTGDLFGKCPFLHPGGESAHNR